jgi:hypothetical protein
MSTLTIRAPQHQRHAKCVGVASCKAPSIGSNPITGSITGTSSSGERRIWDANVAGSIPASQTIFKIRHCSSVAEREAVNFLVTGASPVSVSIGVWRNSNVRGFEPRVLGAAPNIPELWLWCKGNTRSCGPRDAVSRSASHPMYLRLRQPSRLQNDRTVFDSLEMRHLVPSYSGHYVPLSRVSREFNSHRNRHVYLAQLVEHTVEARAASVQF